MCPLAISTRYQVRQMSYPKSVWMDRGLSLVGFDARCLLDEPTRDEIAPIALRAYLSHARATMPGCMTRWSRVSIFACLVQCVNPLLSGALGVTMRIPMERDTQLVRAIDLEGVSTAAQRLKVSRQRVLQMINEEKLDYYKFGSRKMVHKRDVDRLIATRTKRAG
jgi:excisionase family DNA binding protein